MRSCQNLPLCLTKPIAADFRMVLLLAKSEPIRKDNVSVITYVRRKKCCEANVIVGREEQSENTREQPSRLQSQWTWKGMEMLYAPKY